MEIEEFIKELNLLNIKINQQQLNQFEKYYQLLIEENKKKNLTRIVDKKEVYLKHFYDSATIVKVIDLSQEKILCDLGSGAGFPGIVLKILFPHLEIILIDSLKKRVDFLNLIIKQLDLKKIEAIHTRIEDFSVQNREKFDVVTSRAVAPLNVLLEISIPLVKKDKNFVAMKSNISQEIITAEKIIKQLFLKTDKIIEFYLPIEESLRTLIKFKKIKDTPKIFPRRIDIIKKKSC